MFSQCPADNVNLSHLSHILTMIESIGNGEEKENTFHSSHTQRYSNYRQLDVPSISIDRPETKENELVTRYYCEFDNYLLENNQRTSSYMNGGWMPLTCPQEDLIEYLEAACLKKTTEYNSWDNTTSVSYSIPSTYEVDTICEKKESSPVKYSLVDGKLYNRDLIYRYSALSHTWLPICHKTIALPEFKTSNGKVEAKIVQLTIASITSQFVGKTGIHDNYRNKGFLKHNTQWHLGNSLSVLGDVYIDLGKPQIVTHIGTIGSFIQTKLYPEHLNYSTYERKKKRFRRKYNQGILVEDESAQSWCVSYRLMYKKSANEPYEFIGHYNANQNSYELVVNDLRSNLPSVPIRYLLLKPLSNRPRNFPAYSSCRMCISVYGKAPEVPKNKVWSDDGGDVKNEVQLIRYTLCVPPVKPIRFKQPKRNWDYWDVRDDSSKHIIKQRQMNEIIHAADDLYDEDDTNFDDPMEYAFMECSDKTCRICYSEPDIEWAVYYEPAKQSKPKVFDARLGDESMWPPLPTSGSSKGVRTVIEGVLGSITDSVSDVAEIDSSEGSSYENVSLSSRSGEDGEWECV